MRATAVVACAAMVVILALGGAVAVSIAEAGPAAAASSCSEPLGGGEIRVVMVVDPGETGSSGPSATCLVVPSGTSGRSSWPGVHLSSAGRRPATTGAA